MAHKAYVITFTFWLLSLITMTNSTSDTACSPTDSGPVEPTTPLLDFLQLLQETALETYGPQGFDPKLYVDMSLKKNLNITLEAFGKLSRSENGSVSSRDLDGFLLEYMEGADEDLVYVEPADFVPEPDGFLPLVENAEVRAWALEVHSLWKNLSRRASDKVLQKPEFHTLLPLKELVIIPGARFREVYYWDSYWTIRGLLASKMFETAKGIVTNLISLIDKYGHVLNGARAYYTNRSEPPLLSSMILDIYERTGDKDFVKKSLPALIKEYRFWNSGIHKVTIKDAWGSAHNLSRYYAKWNKPRPESSTIDTETASSLPNACEKTQLYRELSSTAESGWDFSSRWMRNASDLTTLSMTSIIPVDLNALVLKMEVDIAFLASVLGESSIALSFSEASKARQKAINSVFWNEEMGQWLDYWLSWNNTAKDEYKWEASNQNKNLFASNFVPLWINLIRSDGRMVEKAIQGFRNSGLLCPAGVATSKTNTGQQWDYPNGWAPLQHMIVEGFATYGSHEATALARDIVLRWIRTNYAGYKKMGVMHEKYNVEECGSYGGGGEYGPQTGFGWTNGVVLAFLEKYGWPKEVKAGCE